MLYQESLNLNYFTKIIGLDDENNKIYLELGNFTLDDLTKLI